MRGEDSIRDHLGEKIVVDHPRMRGEDYVSPDLPSVTSWITPACAGKTGIEDIQTMLAKGSPPHARGRQLSER